MKKLLIVLVGILLFSTAIPSMAIAQGPNGKGPAEKATGSIGFLRSSDNRQIYVEFNAHEAKENRPAKGIYHWWNYNQDDSLHREVIVEIQNVDVDGNEAWFDGVCTYDSWGSIEGRILYVRVVDGGTPGTNGDVIEWSWDTSSYIPKPIDEGNIVVHS